MLDRIDQIRPGGATAPAPATRAPVHPAGTPFADVLATRQTLAAALKSL